MKNPTIKEKIDCAYQASFKLARLTTPQRNEALKIFSDLLLARSNQILEANQKDLSENKKQISASLYDRLKLTPEKILTLKKGILDLRELEDPLGKILLKTQLDEHLFLEKITTPLGVIGIIFESRPDVIPQIASLLLKSGNVGLLKGGKEASHTNEALMSVIDELGTHTPYLPPDWLQLLVSRDEVEELLKYHHQIQLIIPRGSKQLIEFVMNHTKIPVLGHADGVCHIYVHENASLQQAIPLIIDAKTQYPAACNSVETVLLDESIAPLLLPELTSQLLKKNVKIKVDELAQSLLLGLENLFQTGKLSLTTDSDYFIEYSSLTLNIKIVKNISEAIRHINHYGSHHTDGILSENILAQNQFLQEVDSACVFVNASTRFSDGYRFGFGAEVGIATGKIHARGPVGLEGLTSYKYLLRGRGEVVASYVGPEARPFLHKREPL